MNEREITNNRFNPKTTKTLIIHGGRFHADDMLFAAMAQVAAEKYRNHIEIIRTCSLPDIYSESIVVGDIGLGIYDHHTNIDGTISIGSQNNTEDHMAAACGLLYQDIKDILFRGNSETKQVFEAFIDIIEHCDNTSDNNTFSDSINYLYPMDNSKIEEMSQRAIQYCNAVVKGFIAAHEKEISGKIWATPKICGGIVPGITEKKNSRYWKASNQVKNRYKYVSFNNKTDMKLRSMDTYSLACGVLSHQKRQLWRAEIEANDLKQITELERRELEEWPKVLANMQNKTLYTENYIPYGPYVKDINALFIVMPSQREGYTINVLKTNTGKYRFDPKLLVSFEGCTFIANDQRFVFFDTKEHALEAAYTAGKTVDAYLEKYGFNAYRDIYGKCAKEYTNDFYQDLVSEDIALNLYAKDKIANLNSLTVDEYHRMQIAVINNPYLIHSFCSRCCVDGDNIRWNTDVQILGNKDLTKDKLLTRNTNGASWDIGLRGYLDTQRGIDMLQKVHPDKVLLQNTIERTIIL